ncbi:hypothetical protein JOC36_000702 [Weissella uvarum]|uniref:DUF4097 family beta strand repeat-containing protein n=1 Tax=Weissella uvarum TaxID=1479233 RepID=UPI0019615200|nr:DUF4097 family beta strand repeat-containing protein [Weissella uvarum]MBM7617153.1 hypothetical protein [Weissella uvarum]MCM0595449.1 DUF4097 family beta strand repeat protein [Weissella uvarum]
MRLKAPLIIGSVLSLAGAGLMYFNFDNANFNLAVDGRRLKTVDVRKQSQTYNQNDIERLNLNVKDQQINVREGDSNKWIVKTISYDGKQPSVELKNKQLNVTANNMNNNFVMTTGNGEFHFSSSSYDEGTGNAMTIIAPKGVKIKNINVTGDDGGIVLDKLHAAQTKVSLTDGGVRMSDFTGGNFDYHGEDGRIALDDVNLKRMKVVGKDMHIEGSGLKLQMASQIKLADGNVRIDRIKVPGFNLHTDNDISFNQSEDDKKDGFYVKRSKNAVKRGNQTQALTINAEDAHLTLSQYKGLPDENDYSGDDYSDEDSDDTTDDTTDSTEN